LNYQLNYYWIIFSKYGICKLFEVIRNQAAAAKRKKNHATKNYIKDKSVHKELIISQAWGCTPVIPVLREQEDLEFEKSLGYKVRPCVKKQKQTNNNNKKTYHTRLISEVNLGGGNRSQDKRFTLKIYHKKYQTN
jgi:hypothetical protein